MNSFPIFSRAANTSTLVTLRFRCYATAFSAYLSDTKLTINQIFIAFNSQMVGFEKTHNYNAIGTLRQNC